MAAIAAVAVSAIAWINAATAPTLSRAPGRVLSCDIRLTHYNATNALPKVFLTYAYSVGPAEFTNAWEGFWPATKSPNALPPDRLGQLKTPGNPLVVFYNPADPRQSSLHGPTPTRPAIYAFAAIVITITAIVYIGHIYPTWKTR